LLAAILLALLVSRLLLTPIHKVRESALDVAHRQLPEAVARIRSGAEPAPFAPIEVHTKEEIGQLARAVDDLHQQAVVLAAGEAGLRAQVSEMFVTLSRRNTSLVNQQLGLIDALEKDEEDPARLESLFRLDHLASRMRRTADSLLVLAGADAQHMGQQGLTVGEAMQAATAGVQDYRRVHVGPSTLSTKLTDDAAPDVVHLLTELVDNALAYSAPSTSVEIGSSHRADGVVLDIIDSGLGIPDDTRAVLNERLSSDGAVTADTARRMGLFVVSRLAQRHGIEVELHRNEHGGTTATVLLPRALFPDLPPQLEPETAAPVAQATSVPPKLPEPPEPPHLAPVSVDALAAEAASSSRLRAVLDGALGSGLAHGSGERLPVRRPGESLADTPAALTPVIPVTPAVPVVAPPPVSAPVASEAAPPAEMAPPMAPEPAPAAPAPAQVLERPDPLLAPRDALDGTMDEDDEFDSPIFRSMRSAWLSSGGEAEPWTTSEVEAGWKVAEKAVEAPVTEELTPSGLPLRRPGAHLVPGGVTKQGSTIARDPEALRARLAAHAAGVSRGRRTAAAPAAATTPDHPHTEADPA
jgi:signal transduction histidine kinase